MSLTSIDLSLQPKQEQLFSSMQKTGSDVATIIGWGGARGAAKSGGLRRINLARRFTHPGTNSIIIRRTYKDVKQNHIDKYLQEFPVLADYHHISNNEFVLPTSPASKIVFGYAENLAAIKQQFMGVEYYDIFVDQAEQFSEQELRIIKTANRWPGTKQGECKLAMFFNPGGIGTEYLRRIFWQKRYTEHERPEDFEFIQAYGWDNFEWFRSLGMSPREFYDMPSDERFQLFITQTQYGRELNALPPALRAGHLLGNFESFEGQYYAGVWDESRQILTEKQLDELLQPWWTCWVSIDWGFAHHACVLWFAAGKVNPARFKAVFGLEIPREVEVVVCYRELVVCETEEQDLAAQIVDCTPQAERKLIRETFLSPDAWQKRGAANTIADTMTDVLRRGGIASPVPAQDERVIGWRLIYSLLRSSHDVAEPDYAETADELLAPMLFVGPQCTEVAEAIPLAMRNDKQPGKLEDVLKTPTKADDVLDAVRYGCASMLAPKDKAPLSIRAKEYWDTLPAESPDQVQKRAMAMMAFEQKNKEHRRRKSSWVR